MVPRRSEPSRWQWRSVFGSARSSSSVTGGSGPEGMGRTIGRECKECGTSSSIVGLSRLGPAILRDHAQAPRCLPGQARRIGWGPHALGRLGRAGDPPEYDRPRRCGGGAPLARLVSHAGARPVVPAAALAPLRVHLARDHHVRLRDRLLLLAPAGDRAHRPFLPRLPDLRAARPLGRVWAAPQPSTPQEAFLARLPRPNGAARVMIDRLILKG